MYGAVVSSLCFLFSVGMLYFSMEKELTSFASFVLPINSIPLPEEIHLINHFYRKIAVYFEDGESGVFLTNLNVLEDSTIQSSVGQTFYVTEIDGWKPLATVTILPQQEKYIFAPLVRELDSRAVATMPTTALATSVSTSIVATSVTAAKTATFNAGIAMSKASQSLSTAFVSSSRAVLDSMSNEKDLDMLSSSLPHKQHNPREKEKIVMTLANIAVATAITKLTSLTTLSSLTTATVTSSTTPPSTSPLFTSSSLSSVLSTLTTATTSKTSATSSSLSKIELNVDFVSGLHDLVKPLLMPRCTAVGAKIR